MSWLDDLVDDGELMSQRQRLDFTADLPPPSFFSGSFDAIGQGLVRGAIEGVDTTQSTFVQAAGASQATDLAISGLYTGEGQDQIDRVNEDTGQMSSDIAAHTLQAERLLQIDPATTGMAGKILNEASAILPRTVLGSMVAGPVGGAVFAGAPAGYAAKQTIQADGVDEGTAMAKGGVDALTTGVGVLLPAARLVGPILGDAAIAIGANVGLGATGRGASAEILERNGYTAQAAQYKAFDKTALITDAVLGAAFFGVGRMSGGARPTGEQVDAALIERKAQHIEVDSAPGIPVDVASSMSHQQFMESATAQLSRGEPVTVPDGYQGEFLRREDVGEPTAPPLEVALATARSDLEPVLRAELEQQASGSLSNVKDVKAELTSVARSLEGLDDTFRARAKEFQDQGQGRKKAESSARQAIETERQGLTGRQAALNESLDGNRAAEQARADLSTLSRGDVPQQFQDRVNQRADSIIKGFEPSKITSGVKEAVRQTHEQQLSAELDGVLSDIGHNEPDVRARSRADTTSNDVKKQEVQPVLTATKATKNAVKSSKVATESANPAINPDKPASDSAATQKAEASEIDIVREAVASKPDTLINSGYDADGAPVRVKASDALAEVEAEYQAGVREGQSFMAAIKCLLRG